MHTHRSVLAVAAALLVLGVAPVTRAEDVQKPRFAVSVQSDLVYGSGVIDASSSKPRNRDLTLDLYRPLADGKPTIDRPAVILAFGGAFHRGSKGTDRFEEDGASDSSMGEYCETLAAAGYVCATIDYRLVPEDPVLPQNLDPNALMPKAMLKNPLLTGRIDVVRGRMGLPALDDQSREQLWNTVFAATEDLTNAIRFVRANASRFGVDPDRIAIGGFSAGGLAAVNAAYGAGVPVKAVISLSSGIGGYDLRKTVRTGMPPGLFVIGQNDLEGVRASTPGLLTVLAASGVKTETAWMPGFGHFYPMGAPSLGSDLSKLTLEARIARFLDSNLKATP